MNAIKTFNTEETWRWSGYVTASQLEQEGVRRITSRWVLRGEQEFAWQALAF